MTTNPKNALAVIPKVLPFRGRVPVIPDRANPSIPPIVWEILQEAGDVASQRLLDLISDDVKFSRLSTKDQIKLIEMAFNRAYGLPDSPMKKNVHLHLDKDDKGASVNMLDELAHKAMRQLPEFRSPDRGTIPASADKQSDDDAT